jgi:hypothetical protein
MYEFPEHRTLSGVEIMCAKSGELLSPFSDEHVGSVTAHAQPLFNGSDRNDFLSRFFFFT